MTNVTFWIGLGVNEDCNWCVSTTRKYVTELMMILIVTTLVGRGIVFKQ